MNKIYTFPSGFRITTSRMSGTRSISVGIFIGAGSAYESKDNNGISHFIEHMLFKGTKRRNSFQLAEEMENIGVQTNAYTARETTCFYCIGTSDHTEQCVDFLSDILFNSTFEEKGMEKEKGVIIEEINMCEDDPSDICFDLANISIYGNRGLGNKILGPIKNVKKFSKEDCLSYMQDLYRPDNIVISFAGDITEEKAKELAEKYFENEFLKRNYPKNVVAKKFSLKNDSLKRVKKCEQTNLTFSFPAYSRNDERADTLSIMSYILGGGMSSRLFQKLREETGLVYNVDSSMNYYEHSSVFMIYLATAPINLEKAVICVAEVLKDVVENGITDKELTTAKEQFKTSYVLTREKSMSVMRITGRKTLFDNIPMDQDEDLAKIDAITKEQVNAVIKEIVDSKKVASAYVGKKTDLDVLNILKNKWVG